MMLPVSTDYLYSDNLDHPFLSFVVNNKLVHSPINCQVESGKFNNEVRGKEWKTISIGFCMPPKFANSGTLF